MTVLVAGAQMQPSKKLGQQRPFYEMGAAGQQYLDGYDSSPELYAQVAVKTRNHAAVSPHAIVRTRIRVDEVMTSPLIYGSYLTRLMCCPPSCGATAAILISERFAKQNGISLCLESIDQSMAADTGSNWQDPLHMVGKEMVKRAATDEYEQAGVGPTDIDVIELHDCFRRNEILTYENVGLCVKGGETQLVTDGDKIHGGKWEANPSGGLTSKGHQMGATSLAQCTELVEQLRGQVEKRQVPNARIDLQHNIDLVAGVVMTLYRKAA